MHLWQIWLKWQEILKIMRIFCVEILQNVSNFKGNFKKNILQPEIPCARYPKEIYFNQKSAKMGFMTFKITLDEMW